MRERVVLPPATIAWPPAPAGHRIVSMDRAAQQIRFCTTGDGVRIAWAQTGKGPPVVRVAHWLTHIEFDWTNSVWRHFLAELFRVLRPDGWLAVFDGDYATTSAARGDFDPLQSCIDAMLPFYAGALDAVELSARCQNLNRGLLRKLDDR